MLSNHRSRNKAAAILVFLTALVLYMLTMAPTASFWDPGEFIAVAHGLEVTHPPGAPFFELLGRMFSMFMPAAWVAASVNFISVLASALTIMLLYLIIVRLVREFKGPPNEYQSIDSIAMYSGAIIGALSFAVTDSFWFNAVEAEVYALSMFFTAIVVWLALKWAANHDKPYNERWLLLIAYMFGLALGVHLLNLLALFFVGMIIFFKKRELTWFSGLAAGAIAVVSFLLIYPFTVQKIPGIMEGIEKSTYGLIGPTAFIIFVVLILAAAIYYTHTRHRRLINLALLGYTMILLGFSSYALVFIRSKANPPIDENNPETIQSLINYLERKQYGHTPLLKGHDYNPSTERINRNKSAWFPRRYSPVPRHLQQYGQYNSDWDFFWDYQVQHMYIRYFDWNFIGRDSDIQDASWQAGFSKSRHSNNPAHNSYFYLPLLLGLFGMIYHFQKDWKRALAVLVLFIMTGLAIIVFLNQTPLQPRERDYAYVGSFFAFAIWIGMGGVGLVDLVKDYLKSNNIAAYTIAGLLFLAVPVQMCYQNYNDHDRSDRYVASDYAHNLLQSVDYGGILFTNGDNDTFPLWYAQEVEGVRTDVRVVCLSLLRTPWYIKQMRDQWSHESAPLPITLTNQQIDKLTSQNSLHEPDTVRIPVNKKLLRAAFSDASQYRKSLSIKGHPSANVYKPSVDFGMPVDSLDKQLSWYYKGRYLGKNRDGKKMYYSQVNDQVILNILKNNQWLRPVYFANTVSTASQLNLQSYFRSEGMAYRVVPNRHKSNGQFGWLNTHIASAKYHKFRFRKWNAPGNYANENIRRTIFSNTRAGISNLAEAYLKYHQPDRAAKWLKWGENRIPFKASYGNNLFLTQYAYDYARAGDMINALRLAKLSKKPLLDDLYQYVKQANRLQQQYSKLRTDVQKARTNAGLGDRQKLNKRIQQFQNRWQTVSDNINRARSGLVTVQHIYYLAERDQPAARLGKKAKDILGGTMDFPSNKKENDKYFQ